jgi:hypothetical protein
MTERRFPPPWTVVKLPWRCHGQAVATRKAEKGAALIPTRREGVHVVQVHVNNAPVLSDALNNGGHDRSPGW